MLNAKGVAKKLGVSRSWFCVHREELEARGFPAKLPVLKRWNEDAIDAWLARQSKMVAAASVHVGEKQFDALFGL